MAIQKYDFSGKHGSAYRGGQDALFQRAMRAAMKVLPTRGIAPIPAAGGGGGRRGNGGGPRTILALPDGSRWPRKKKKVASKKRFPKRAGKKYTGSVTNPLYQRAIADSLRAVKAALGSKKKRSKKRGKKRASAAQLAARKRFAAAAKARARAGKKRGKSKKPRAASRKARASSVTAAQVIAMAKKHEQRRRLIASKTRKKLKAVRGIVC